MFEKLICLASFVLVLGLTGYVSATEPARVFFRKLLRSMSVTPLSE